MANDLSTNPGVVDSTGLVVNTSGGNDLNVKELVWVGGAGGTLIVSFNGGPAITFTTPAAIDYGPLHHQHLGHLKSLNVTTITGQLLLFG